MLGDTNKMFQVFQNDVPAEHLFFQEERDLSWTTSKFETFEEAREYLIEWLDLPYNVVNVIDIEVNNPMSFGDPNDPLYMTIVEI
jgi:hypothetical protein